MASAIRQVTDEVQAAFDQAEPTDDLALLTASVRAFHQAAHAARTSPASSTTKPAATHRAWPTSTH